MDTLIKYRNDRKKEGASQAELNGLDGRINAGFNSSSFALDLEVLNYRKQLVEGGSSEMYIERLDKHIFHILGSKPAHLIDLQIIDMEGLVKDASICVDKSNETMADLSRKVASALGLDQESTFTLIFDGKYQEKSQIPLSKSSLMSNDKIVVCRSYNSKMACAAREYSMLCHAKLRDATEFYKSIPEETIHKLFTIFSEAKTHLDNPQQLFIELVKSTTQTKKTRPALPDSDDE